MKNLNNLEQQFYAFIYPYRSKFLTSLSQAHTKYMSSLQQEQEQDWAVSNGQRQCLARIHS